MSSIGVDIRGLAEVQASLAKLEPGPSKVMLQKATNAGVKVLKPYVVAETPKRTGKLRKSVSAGQAKRERPAAIVKFRPRVAWYRHMVLEGTKAHRIRFGNQKAAGVPKSKGNIQHPGAKANHILDRAWASGKTAALHAVDAFVDRYLEAL